MLSIKRLLYVISLVVMISGIFLAYGIHEEENDMTGISNAEVTEEALLKGNVREKPVRFYVAGSKEKELYGTILKNVCLYLRDIGADYQCTDTLEELPGTEGTVLIFCDDVISEHVSLLELGDYIRNGGKCVFAAGVAEENQDAYLQAFLGYAEKSKRENYGEFRFVQEFLPVQYPTMKYSAYSMSTWLSLREGANIYAVDAGKGTPLLYSYPYEAGESFVINGTFLTEMTSMGLLSGAIGKLLDTWVCPALGCISVYLDNFPMVTYVDDKLTLELYGRSTEGFIRDVVWPEFQGLSLRNGVPYTSSVITATDYEDAFPSINDSLFTTIGRSALQYGGELAYAMNSDGSDAHGYMNRLFLERFAERFPNYRITSEVQMSENWPSSCYEQLEGNVLTVRGRLDDPERGLGYRDGVCFFPAASYGYEMEEGGLFEIASTLGAYGMVSHVFDVNGFIADEHRSGVWEEKKDQLAFFEDKVLSRTDFLKPVTLKETRNLVKSYCSMSYSWETEGSDRLRIFCADYRKGQTFWLQTDQEVGEVSGAEIKKVSEGYYYVSMLENEAVICWR